VEAGAASDARRRVARRRVAMRLVGKQGQVGKVPRQASKQADVHLRGADRKGDKVPYRYLTDPGTTYGTGTCDTEIAVAIVLL
jgi:hypothetical protein